MRRVALVAQHLPRSAPPAGGRLLAWRGASARSSQGVDNRSAFPHLVPIQTRWNDQDPYAHVNNVVYYEFFDTAVNHWLYHRVGMRFAGDPVIGLCVHSECNFLRQIEYPQRVDAGVRVSKVGRSSVQYECGVFVEGEEEAAALGKFVHVYVDSATRRPTPVPDHLRTAIESELLDPAEEV